MYASNTSITRGVLLVKASDSSVTLASSCNNEERWNLHLTGFAWYKLAVTGIIVNFVF